LKRKANYIFFHLVNYCKAFFAIITRHVISQIFRKEWGYCSWRWIRIFSN